jgi:hypothetical protein
VKPSVITIHVSLLCSALSLAACAMEVDGSVGAAEQALVDDGAINPECGNFRAECMTGKRKMCAKYSERCDLRIGVAGDSLSDEYQGFVNLPGMTWTEQVQADPRINLGSYDASMARGEPRNTGYSTNWARYGQAALDTQWNSPAVVAALGGFQDPRWVAIGPFQAQIDGLSVQIAAGEIDIALVWVGHNDLFIRQRIGAEPTFVPDLIARIVGSALALQAAGTVKVAIVGIAGQAALNAPLAQAAAAAGIAFIDSFNSTINGTPTYTVGGTVLSPFSPIATALVSDLSPTGTGPCALFSGTSLCATPEYAEPFRHYDNVHPNTIYMGLIGNRIVTDLNTTFGFAMRTIADDQLLLTAGL